MEKKATFTKKHEKRLRELFSELGFSGEVLTGRFAGTYNVADLMHNTTLNTLRTINKDLKSSVREIEDQDEWSMTDYQQAKANRLKVWQEYVHLLIGYTLMKEKDARERAKRKEERLAELALLSKVKDTAKIKELEELSVEELEARIAALKTEE